MRYPRYEYWQNEKTGRWFWHRVSRNGKITSDGGEGYSTSSNVRRALRSQGAAPSDMVKVDPPT